MSYCRFGWDGSDVYVYFSVDGFLHCSMCALQEYEWVEDPEMPILGGYLQVIGEEIKTVFDNTEAMVDHLRQHIAAGHTVPDDVIPRLEEDDLENFPLSKREIDEILDPPEER